MRVAAGLAAVVMAAPAAGSLQRSAFAGGWIIEVSGEREHVSVAGYGSNTHALLTAALTDASFEKLAVASATLLDGTGKTVRSESLGGLRPVTASVSRNGERVAVLAASFADLDADPTLLSFDAKGGRWKKSLPQGAVDVLAGPTWVAAFSARGGAAKLFGADGTPLKTSVEGRLARAGDGLAAVNAGTLTLFDARLRPLAGVPVGFAAGQPSAAADGSLIAVTEIDDTPEPGRAIALFDRAGTAAGRVAIDGFGADVVVAPDGAAVLVATSAVPPQTAAATEPTAAPPASGELVLALHDRTGKLRWKYAAKPRGPAEHFAHLSVSAGGKRAAAVLRSLDAADPARVLVFDEKGVVIHKAEGVLTALWLDESGESLFTVEPGGISRFRIDALLRGTAFDPASPGP